MFQDIAQVVHQKRDSKEPISLAIIQQILYNKTDEILEVSENAMLEGSISRLNILNNDLTSTVDKVSEDSKATKSKWQTLNILKQCALLLTRRFQSRQELRHGCSVHPI